MLNRNELGDHDWRFEIKAAREADHSSHDGYRAHLICPKCGDIVCPPVLSTEFVGALRQIEWGLGAIDEVNLKGMYQKCLRGSAKGKRRSRSHSKSAFLARITASIREIFSFFKKLSVCNCFANTARLSSFSVPGLTNAVSV